jgi:hypothetical protein
MPSARPRRVPVDLRPAADGFVEKEFFLDEFRGGAC